MVNLFHSLTHPLSIGTALLVLVLGLTRKEKWECALILCPLYPALLNLSPRLTHIHTADQIRQFEMNNRRIKQIRERYGVEWINA